MFTYAQASCEPHVESINFITVPMMVHPHLSRSLVKVQRCHDGHIGLPCKAVLPQAM